MNNSNKKIFAIFVGGETAGPVMPLLAIAREWKLQDPNLEPIFLDVSKSVANRIVPKHGFRFQTMTSGKVRRYWSIKNLLTPLQILIGVIRSLFLIMEVKPKVVISAGGYVQVPVIIAAWIMRVPRLIHQQDIIPTFSNKLVAPLATKITTTFENSTKDFFQGSGFEKNYSKPSKIIWTGNPCAIPESERVLNKEKKAAAQKLFNLDPAFPTVLLIGGGTGAAGLNLALHHNLPELLNVAQVIHSAGKGKMIASQLDSPELAARYRQIEFIDDMNAAYAAADIVIARAGIGTLTELSVLGKVSIIVPMPNSHQEWNAKFLYDRDAALILDQADITSGMLAKLVRKILFDAEMQKTLQTNIRAIMPANATHQILEIIQSIIHD
jgi:UDP-N-acetylglucosamine--N-acetylmuramyl-(pentapeptide) pyrophosphoryl-undecaprenol N-acetylglucosamine transferase